MKMKRTEIGLIPDDWEVKKLSEIGTFCKGSGISREESNTGDLPAIRYGELYTTHNDYIKSFKSHISNEVASKSRRLKQGDLLFTCSGETKEDIGKCVAFIGSERAYAGGDLLILSPTINIDSLFYGFLLNTNIAVKQKSAMAQGDAIVHISTESIGKVLVPLPPLTEQQRIAKALSDVDALISTTEKLIQKKKNIKQGTMQNLLTGNKRLPGFGPQTKSPGYKQTELGLIPDDWEVKSLNEYIDDFIVPMRDKPTDLTGQIPWCRIEDFDGKYLSESKTNQGVSLETIKKMNLKIFPVNTLLVSCSANLGKCAIVSKELITNQTFIGLVPNKTVNVEYLFYKMSFEESRLNEMATGTTISYLSREQFEKYEITTPPTEEEQTAIANVLSSMDKEIETLNTKLEKYRNLKTAMMQQLLTGKIRLR